MPHPAETCDVASCTCM
ncbi:hypothetical protein AZE42_11026 [Rhizopogon vesiculosus]|uniref:Uncharacterized protein n=1 Tax=Rhizopogon vesiculosus TaxID=180088 RepID=A0A1J8Q3S8_9AGAM|nr:hypothetical protein AZE42_11026 [Rhizopogon vesiculosus]